MVVSNFIGDHCFFWLILINKDFLRISEYKFVNNRKEGKKMGEGNVKLKMVKKCKKGLKRDKKGLKANQNC